MLLPNSIEINDVVNDDVVIDSIDSIETITDIAITKITNIDLITKIEELGIGPLFSLIRIICWNAFQRIRAITVNNINNHIISSYDANVIEIKAKNRMIDIVQITFDRAMIIVPEYGIASK
jgi:hypothetical protein